MRILRSLDHELLRAIQSAEPHALHAAESTLRDIVVDLARQGASIESVISVLRDTCRAIEAGAHPEWVRSRVSWLEARGRAMAVQELSHFFDGYRTPPYGAAAYRREAARAGVESRE